MSSSRLTTLTFTHQCQIALDGFFLGRHTWRAVRRLLFREVTSWVHDQNQEEKNMRMLRLSMCSLVLGAVIAGCEESETETIPENRFGKIYAAKYFNPPGTLDSVEAQFQEMESLGVTHIFLLEPFFERAHIKQALRHTSLKTWMISQIFFNDHNHLSDTEDNPLLAIRADGSVAIGESPGNWLEMACPNNGPGYDPANPSEGYRETTIARIVESVGTHRPYGLSLDFVRYFAFWERILEGTDPSDLHDTCFCSRCLSLFSQAHGVAIPTELTETRDVAAWIHANALEAWIAFKTNTITSFVTEVAAAVKAVDPEIKINVHGVPWRRADFNDAAKRIAGQDFGALAQVVDVISPMCYAKMLEREPAWINSVVEDIAAQIDMTSTMIIPAFQVVGDMYVEGPVTIEEFRAYMNESLKGSSAGVAFWPWEQMTDEQKEVIRQTLM